MEEIFYEIKNEMKEEELEIFLKWTSDIEHILRNISSNAGLASEYHRRKYLELTKSLSYFKIPIIILSGINSLASISLSNYMNQNIVSIMTAIISLIVSSISSIELYLSIQKRSDNELLTYKSYYNLSVKINSMLKLHPKHRHTDADTFLQSCLSEYENLFQSANVNGLGEHDKMVELVIKKV